MRFGTFAAHINNQFGNDDLSLIHRRELCERMSGGDLVVAAKRGGRDASVGLVLCERDEARQHART